MPGSITITAFTWVYVLALQQIILRAHNSNIRLIVMVMVLMLNYASELHWQCGDAVADMLL